MRVATLILVIFYFVTSPLEEYRFQWAGDNLGATGSGVALASARQLTQSAI